MYKMLSMVLAVLMLLMMMPIGSTVSFGISVSASGIVGVIENPSFEDGTSALGIGFCGGCERHHNKSDMLRVRPIRAF